MSNAEKYIEDYTRRCSNIEYTQGVYTPSYYPWLTPDDTKRAVEIAKREMLNKICEWIGKQQDLLEDSFSDPNDFADILKQAMKNE